jgi:hypothetical protein
MGVLTTDTASKNITIMNNVSVMIPRRQPIGCVKILRLSHLDLLLADLRKRGSGRSHG